MINRYRYSKAFFILYFLFILLDVLLSWQPIFLNDLSKYIRLGQYLILGILMLLLLLTTSKRKYIYIFLVTCLVCGATLIFGGNTIRLITFLLMPFIALHIDFKKLLRVHITAETVGVIVILLSVLFGFVENDSALRSVESDVYRYYLGFYYPTFLANYFFHIIIFYFYYKSLRGQEYINIFETIFILICNFFIYDLTDTRAVYYLIYLLILGLWIYRYLPYVKSSLTFKFFSFYSFPFLGLISFGLSYFYNAESSWMSKLNSLLSSRLSLAKEAFETYGIHIFGAKTQWATGRLGIERTTEYFYVDSSYLNILFTYGLIILLVVVGAMILLGKWNYRKGHYVACFILIIFAIHCFSDPQLLELRYNPLICIVYKVYLDYFEKGFMRLKSE